MEYQNVPDSVKFSHLSNAPTMLFGLSNKLILYLYHKNHPVEVKQSDVISPEVDYYYYYSNSQYNNGVETQHYNEHRFQKVKVPLVTAAAP